MLSQTKQPRHVKFFLYNMVGLLEILADHVNDKAFG